MNLSQQRCAQITCIILTKNASEDRYWCTLHRYMFIAGNVWCKTASGTVDEVIWVVYGYGSGVGLLCPAVQQPSDTHIPLATSSRLTHSFAHQSTHRCLAIHI